MKTGLMNVAEITLNYQYAVRPKDRPKICSSNDAVQCFRGIWSDKLEYIEEMYLMLLNRGNRVLGIMKISQGGTSGTVVDPKIVFQAALKANAASFLLSHNHPSGNIQPSEADKALTKQLVQAGKFLEISFLDHLILTPDGFYSFADEGMMQ